MKKIIAVLLVVFLAVNICLANDYTRIENITSMGKYIITPEFFIEVWEFDTDKSSCWIPSDRLIVTPRGYLINVDRQETVRMVDIVLRKLERSTGLYDDIDKEVNQ